MRAPPRSRRRRSPPRMAQLHQARVNRGRTEVRSPVNGRVTNLLLRAGDYATAGTVNVAVIDTDSFWIDGYFEETKLAHIHVGDGAKAELLGYPALIDGRVESITLGISNANASPSTQGLPNVDPVYTWVRLAQRVPVRIRIERVPDGVTLVAGMNATVSVGEPGAHGGTFWKTLRDRFGGPSVSGQEHVPGRRPAEALAGKTSRFAGCLGAACPGHEEVKTSPILARS